MQDFITNVIRKSEIVVVSTVSHTEEVTVGGQEFVRVRTEVAEYFKGGSAGPRALTVDVWTAGKETPQIATEQEYLFFLRAPEGTKPQPAGPWHLTELTRPIAVPAKERDSFLRCLRESVKVAAANPTEPALKQHIIRMLQSGVHFFQSDASRVAVNISDWRDDEIGLLIAILSGEEGGPTISGSNERDNLITVVVQHGTPARVTTFAREQMKNADSEAIYFGLFKRRDMAVDPIIWELLKDADPAVRSEALRVVGLLRRADILDVFEKQYRPSAKDDLRGAIERARALVARD